jgi:hypothetical protein
MRIPVAFLAIAASTASVAGQGRPITQPFAIEISANTPTVKAGSGVVIGIRLTNNSDELLGCGRAYNDMTGQDEIFIIEVRDDHGHLTPKRVYPHPELAGGSAVTLGCDLKRGETLTDSQDVARIYDMTRPGRYVIQVSRPVSFADKKAGVVKSNKVTVTIVP